MTLSLRDVRYLLVDMDGVIYRGQTALPGAAQLIAFLQSTDIGYLLVTNNSTLSPIEFTHRVGRMGMAVPPEHILTSGVATAEYLASVAPAGSKVFVVGEGALIDQLEARGFEMAGRDADYVVCGWDKTISFDKLATATLAIRDGATFIGTNPDKTYPLENDLLPGAGSLIAALTASTDQEPLVVGKPEPIMVEQALRMLGASASQTAILGDRLDTDILGGIRAGIHTIMVTTGISTVEDVARTGIEPDLVVANLYELLQMWHEALD